MFNGGCEVRAHASRQEGPVFMSKRDLKVLHFIYLFISSLNMIELVGIIGYHTVTDYFPGIDIGT